MINPTDFRVCAINPALSALTLAGIGLTQTAADLVMATAAVESAIGTYLRQEAGGPGLGVFQEDPNDLADLEARLTPQQKSALLPIMTPEPLGAQIETNLKLAVAICRLHYWHACNDPLPPRTGSGLWNYYKLWYNSSAGATTQAEFNDALKLTDIIF